MFASTAYTAESYGYLEKLRILGVMITGSSFGIAAFAGLWLAGRIASGESLEQIALPLILIFVPLTGLVGLGIYLYVRGGVVPAVQAAPVSTLQTQREMMALLRDRQQSSLSELAQLLKTGSEDLPPMIYELVRLDLFHGYLNPERDIVALLPTDQVNRLTQCAVCGAALASDGWTTLRCGTCGTEYFRA